MVKWVSLYIILLKVTEAIDDFKWGLTVSWKSSTHPWSLHGDEPGNHCFFLGLFQNLCILKKVRLFYPFYTKSNIFYTPFYTVLIFVITRFITVHGDLLLSFSLFKHCIGFHYVAVIYLQHQLMHIYSVIYLTCIILMKILVIFNLKTLICLSFFLQIQHMHLFYFFFLITVSKNFFHRFPLFIYLFFLSVVNYGTLNYFLYIMLLQLNSCCE